MSTVHIYYLSIQTCMKYNICIHIYIFPCVYLYVIHILCTHKLSFWMWLITNNRLTVLISIIRMISGLMSVSNCSPSFIYRSHINWHSLNLIDRRSERVEIPHTCCRQTGRGSEWVFEINAKGMETQHRPTEKHR